MTTIPEPGHRAAPWWHLPAISEPPEDTSPPGGRLAYGASFAFTVALGGIIQGYLWHTHGAVLDAVDLAAGTVACLALWWRRAHPVALFLVAFGAAIFSPLAQGAGLVAVCTAVSQVRGRALFVVVVLAVTVGAISRCRLHVRYRIRCVPAAQVGPALRRGLLSSWLSSRLRDTRLEAGRILLTRSSAMGRR